MIEIKRNRYLNQLVSKIGNGMIKIITGLRRVGKSYLLNKLFCDYLMEHGTDPDRIVKFDFGSAKDLKLIGEDYYQLRQEHKRVEPNRFLDYINKCCCGEGTYFLLLDEVQELNAFEFVLNGLLSEGRFDIYVTGSNAKFLTKDIITEFRGRGDKIHVLPLAFSECWNLYDSDPRIALEKYLTFGGLPQAVTTADEEARIDYIKTQIEETYLTDIIDRHGIRNTAELDTLFNVLASNISSLVNPKKLSATFRSAGSILNEHTIANYIKYFQDAFLIDISNRFDVKGRKYIFTPYKIYFEDLGVRNARLNFRQTEFTHLMENAIYNELRYRGYSVDVGQVEIRETPEGKEDRFFAEIDFIANKGSRRYYIQSAYKIPNEAKKQQELRSLLNTDDSFKKIVIVYDYIVPRQDENGILYLGLLDFLSDINSLER